MHLNRIPRNTELRGGLRWRLGKHIDGVWGILAALIAVFMSFCIVKDCQAVFRIPVVKILGAVGSFILLHLAAAITLIFYCFAGTLKPFKFIASMLPTGPVVLKSMIGLPLTFIILWSLTWKVWVKDNIRYRSALLRTSVYTLIGATAGVLLSLFLHK